MISTIKKIVINDKFLVANYNDINNRQYKIPKYQRHYDWDPDNARNLFEDIYEAYKIKMPHYTGSFLLYDGLVPTVIDGQQRFITFLLILKAFQLNCTSEDLKTKIDKLFYLDPQHKVGENLRILVTDQDKDVFQNIIVAKKISSINCKETKLYNNFKLAFDFFNEKKSSYSEDELFKDGFGAIQICELIIESDKDDEPQKIFRDLNAKGQALKNSDLIRNYLLMKNDSLYDMYWHDIEKNFTTKNEFQSNLFENFIFDYVLMKIPEKINDNKIFNSYVNYCERESTEFYDNGEFSRDKAVEDMSKYAKIYKLFLGINLTDEEKQKYSITIKLLDELEQMNQRTARPFLMRVINDECCDEPLINVETLNKIINLVVTYYVRAVINKLSSGSWRGYFSTMYKNIFENVKENKKVYYEAIFKYITQKGADSAMPSEENTLNSIKEFKLYKNKAVCRYLLNVIVNNRYPSEFKEKVLIENTTIEHLMPQTPKEEWITELGGEEKLNKALEYVDTLGNLSLADKDKNSELSNKSRKEKAEILKKHSQSLSVLNDDFINLNNNYSLEFIKNRCDKLSDILKKCFHIESVNTKNIYFDNYDVIKGTCEYSEIFIDRKPTYIEINGESFNATSYWEVGNEMMRYIVKNYSNELDSVIKDRKFGSHLIIIKEPKKRYCQISNSEYYFHYEHGGNLFFAACRIFEGLKVPMENIRLMLRKQTFDTREYKFTIVDNLNEFLDLDKYIINKPKRDVVAYGYYFDGKMIVVAGSKIAKDNKVYFNDCFIALRKQLVEQNIVDENFVFVKNIIFNSPSAASCALLGYNTNGKTTWKREKDNKLLRDTLIT